MDNVHGTSWHLNKPFRTTNINLHKEIQHLSSDIISILNLDKLSCHNINYKWIKFMTWLINSWKKCYRWHGIRGVLLLENDQLWCRKGNFASSQHVVVNYFPVTAWHRVVYSLPHCYYCDKANRMIQKHHKRVIFWLNLCLNKVIQHLMKHIYLTSFGNVTEH